MSGIHDYIQDKFLAFCVRQSSSVNLFRHVLLHFHIHLSPVISGHVKGAERGN